MKQIVFLVLFSMLMSCTNQSDKPLIIGHRGAMGYETENTLASVEKAIELGVDMVEIDVFQISSGEIVVFHDERVDRLSNSAGNIKEYNIFDLKKLILDGGHQIPMLQDVLKQINGRVALNIELKDTRIADNIHQIITGYSAKPEWSESQFIVSSFDWEELRKYREYSPEGRIAVLTEGDPLEAMEVARELNAEAINPHYSQVNAENVAKLHEAGFKVYTYTVNDPAEFQRLKAAGVDGVFSDYPDRMK
jgi:glycerophosphoryl diester phosphodiesterase